MEPIKAGVGCYVDGHWGKYATARMVQVAQTFGFELTPEEQAVIDKDMRGDAEGDDFEYVVDIADKAEVWLNAHTPGTRLIWHWHEGEFFLSPWDED